jgi:hypothetical protein
LHVALVSVPVVLVVALALTQHIAALALTSNPFVAGRKGMLPVSGSGSTPESEFVASVMLVAVLS